MRKVFRCTERKSILDKLSREYSKCWYCGRTLKEKHIDHIVPQSKDGVNDIDNLALVCSRCNYAKQDDDLMQFLQWFAHIRSSNFECYILKKLKMGLDGNVNDKLQKGFYESR